MLQTKVRSWVQISDEDHGSVIAPVLMNEAEQRFRIRTLVTDEIFLKRYGPTKRGMVTIPGFKWMKRFQQSMMQPGPVTTASNRYRKPHDPHPVFTLRSFGQHVGPFGSIDR